MHLCCIFGGALWNQPLKSLNGAIWRIQNGPGTKSRLFEGPKGPKKSRAPRKVKILCKGPFWILQMAPFSDFKGWFHNAPPNIQHRCINSYHYLLIWWQDIIMEPDPEHCKKFTFIFLSGPARRLPSSKSRLRRLLLWVPVPGCNFFCFCFLLNSIFFL